MHSRHTHTHITYPCTDTQLTHSVLLELRIVRTHAFARISEVGTDTNGALAFLANRSPIPAAALLGAQAAERVTATDLIPEPKFFYARPRSHQESANAKC